MSWFMGGLAVVGTVVSARNNKREVENSARMAAEQSKNESAAIVKERLNATVRASYQAAFAQRQLALQKRQIAEQSHEVRTSALGAKSDISVGAASTDSVGSSIQALYSDVDMRSQQALDKIEGNLENTIENYNDELKMMVLNIDQTTPSMRKYEYTGPSGGQIFGSAILGGLSQFASSYAARSMSLGLGRK